MDCYKLNIIINTIAVFLLSMFLGSYGHSSTSNIKDISRASETMGGIIIPKGFDEFRDLEFKDLSKYKNHPNKESDQKRSKDKEGLSRVNVSLPLKLNIVFVNNASDNCEHGGNIISGEILIKLVQQIYYDVDVFSKEKVRVNINDDEGKSNTIRNVCLVKLNIKSMDDSTNLLELTKVSDVISNYYMEGGFYGASAFIPPQKIKNDMDKEFTIIVSEPSLSKNISVYSVTDKNYDKPERTYYKEMIEKYISSVSYPVKRGELESIIVQLEKKPGLDIDVAIRPVLNKIGLPIKELPNLGVCKKEETIANNDKISANNECVNEYILYHDHSKITIRYKHNIAKISYKLDSYGDRYVGPNLMLGNAEFNNLFETGEQIILTAVGDSGGTELKHGSIKVSYPISKSIDLTGEWRGAKSQPGYRLEKFDVSSQADEFSFGGRFHVWSGRITDMPWNSKTTEEEVSEESVFSSDLRSLTGAIYGYLKYTHTHSSNQVFKDVPVNKDELRSVSAGLTLDATGRARVFRTEEYPTLREFFETFIDLSVTQGIDWDGANNRGDLLSSRVEASPDFTKINLTSILGYQIKNFPSPPFSIVANIQVEGQYAWKPLFSTSEMSIGNRNGARGFAPTEMLGDQALGIRTELGVSRIFGLLLNTDPDFIYDSNGMKVALTKNEKFLRLMQSNSVVHIYGFSDMGYVWNLDSDAAAARTDYGKLLSIGGGLRIQNEKGLIASVELAKPLKREPNIGTDYKPIDMSTKVYFSLGVTGDFVSEFLGSLVEWGGYEKFNNEVAK